MSITQIDHFVLTIANITSTVDFYYRVLGKLKALATIAKPYYWANKKSTYIN